MGLIDAAVNYSSAYRGAEKAAGQIPFASAVYVSRDLMEV